MAKDEDFAERRRREEREERERESEQAQKKGGTAGPGVGGSTGAPDNSERLEQMMSQVEPLIHQVNQLYHMFQAGAEKRPPIERRKQLDQLMASLTSAPKLTPTLRFRFSSLQSSYQTHKDLWERVMKKMEGR